MGLIDWLQELRRPRTESTGAEGWGPFPPAPEDAIDSEVHDYLDRCSFDAAVVHAGNRLEVRLLDAEQQVWTFRFRNGGISISAWPDDTPPHPDGLSSDRWGPGSGINYLGYLTTCDRKGNISYLYELETTVAWLHLESDGPVQVIPPDPDSA